MYFRGPDGRLALPNEANLLTTLTRTNDSTLKGKNLHPKVDPTGK